jgi:hypothetical protein
VGCGQSDQPSRRRQDERFDEELTEDPRAVGAQRIAHRNLGITCRDACVNEDADGHTRDDEHEKDRQMRNRHVQDRTAWRASTIRSHVQTEIPVRLRR